MRAWVLMAVLGFAALSLPPAVATAQEVATDFDSYNALFEAFEKRRNVLLTQLEKLQGKKDVPPEDFQKIVDGLKALDREYLGALKTYIDKHPDAKDLEYARYERALVLSKFEDLLAEAVSACDDFLAKHAASELAPQVRFARAQSLFRSPGKEREALIALDDFITRHDDLEEADFARTMRVRALLFLDRVDDARTALRAIMKLDKVKNDDNARAYIQGQLDNLDWIGRDLPKFGLVDTGGDPLVSDDLLGKPLLLFFWDSNSAVCLDELPFVRAIHEKHGKDGLRVVGIAVNKSEAALTQWLKKTPLPWINAWVDREKENTIVKRLEVSAIPFSVMFDRNGKVFRYDVRSDDLARFAPMLMR